MRSGTNCLGHLSYFCAIELYVVKIYPCSFKVAFTIELLQGLKETARNYTDDDILTIGLARIGNDAILNNYCLLLRSAVSTFSILLSSLASRPPEARKHNCGSSLDLFRSHC